MFTQANLKKIASWIITTSFQMYQYIMRRVIRLLRYLDRKKNEIPNWSTREKDHPAWIRYSVVIALIILAIVIKTGVNSVMVYKLPFMIFYSVIVLSAWYGGLRPGLLAVILSALLAHFIYLPQVNVYEASSSFSPLVLFMLEGFLIVGLSHSMHRAQQTLEEKKQYSQYYASIAQHISDALISTDLDFRIQSWNDGAEMLYGWKRHEVMGRALHEVIPTKYPASLKKTLPEFLEADGHWRGEVLHQRKNSSRVYILTSMSWLQGEDKQPMGIVMVNRDITDRKKLEQGKDDFIGLASHELKTPLTSIQLYTSILKQRFEKAKDTGSMTYLSKIDEQMDKLLELVNHLLDVSKAQAGKMQFHFEEVAFDPFIRTIVKDIQFITKTHTFEVRGETDARVSLDKDRFRQVIVNILNNAVKYSAQADKVVVTLMKDSKSVKVSVRDFGIGIPREKQEKIFDRFYQVSDSKGYTFSGLGLGLYISREIIEKHSGTLRVDSEEGKGSTFTISIPSVKHHEGKKDHSHR
jgi:PAS domain S-box-containing protein